MTADLTPVSVLATAATLGYPPILLSPMLAKVAAGEVAGQAFTGTATGTTLGIAMRRLLALNASQA